MTAVLNILLDWGVKRVIILSCVASRVGLKTLEKSFPGARLPGQHHGSSSSSSSKNGVVSPRHVGSAVEMYVGAIDDDLTDDNVLVPGLGDVGDRLYGGTGKGGTGTEEEGGGGRGRRGSNGTERGEEEWRRGWWQAATETVVENHLEIIMTQIFVGFKNQIIIFT